MLPARPALPCLFVLSSSLCGCTTLLGDFSTREGLTGDGSVPVVGDAASREASPDASSDGTDLSADARLDANGDAPALQETGAAVREAGLGAEGSADAAGCPPPSTLCNGSCVASTDVHNCGACARDCTLLAHVVNAGVACNGGRCAYSCAPGFRDCADAGAGCETDLSSTSHCGACGTACAGGTPLCAPSSASGGSSCTSGCPSTAPTGCMGACVDELTSNNACGGCGPSFACSAGTTCQGGRCVGAHLTLSVSQATFVATAVGAVSAPQTFTLSNTGSGTSGAITTSIGGVSSSEFAIVVDACRGKSLAPGASCTVSVQFVPASRGSKSATLDFDGGQPFAALAGTGEDTVTLTVTKSGAGAGTVTGDSVACGATCSETVTRTSSADPVVALTATAVSGSTFTGWSGACAGASPSCTVTLSQSQSVNAQFDPQTVTLQVTGRIFGPGSGTVTSTPAGIRCTAPCVQSMSVPVGSTVLLTSSGGPLVVWGTGTGCTGSTCSVGAITATTNLTVTFIGNNLVFPTSTTHDGNLGGLAGADAMCRQAASRAGLPGSYVAWLATSTTNAASRVGSARGWVRPDGLPFADTVAALKAGQVFYPPNIDELGRPVNNEVYTGAGVDGSLVTGIQNFNCNDFTSNTAALYSVGGGTNGGSFTWTNGQGVICSSLAPVYCFGTDLSNPVTYSPAVGRRAFVSTGTLTTSAGMGSADALCRAEASASRLPNAAGFLAMLASTTASADSRFDLSGANWVRPDGIPITSTPTDIQNGIIASVTQHADGTYTDQFIAAAAGAPYTSVVGTADTTCNNWSTTTGTLDIAQPGYGGFVWFQFSKSSCASPPTVFCFEK